MSDNPLEVYVKGILSFEALFKPKASEEGKAPKYRASILIDPSTKEGKKVIKALEDAQEYAIQDKWPKKRPKLSADKLLLRDGNDKEWAGYENMMYVSASNANRPVTLDNHAKPVTAEDGVLYNGCKVIAIIRVWAQDSADYGKRINASLEGVQYAGKGIRFGAPPLSEDAFQDLGDVDGDDDDDDDEDEKPVAKKKKAPVADDDDDDDDEKPVIKKKKRLADEDDDEEEAPRAKKKKPIVDDDDDDEEEAPRAKKKKKPVDDEDDDE